MRTFLLTLIFLTFVIMMSWSAYARDAKLCYSNVAMEPFIKGNNEVPSYDKGLLVNKILNAANQINIAVTFYRAPWKRCIKDLQQNKADGIFAIIWTAKRNEFAKFPTTSSNQLDHSKALWQGNYLVFHHFNNDNIWDGENFNGLKTGISAPLGYVVEDMLKKKGVLNNTTRSPEEMFKLIALKKIDGYVVDKEIGQYIIRKFALEKQVKYSSIPFYKNDWYLAFSKNFYRTSQKTAESFWSALKDPVK